MLRIKHISRDGRILLLVRKQIALRPDMTRSISLAIHCELESTPDMRQFLKFMELIRFWENSTKDMTRSISLAIHCELESTPDMRQFLKFMELIRFWENSTKEPLT
ncbi:hypothetical protein DY000_02030848 [Brassica cretica]|uniref:Uncharacterized protein n=1 Tax=Brassica cretica TaxID=69181 RepID=A0ABQ7DTE9_BRACR|nr:hypothetical protein DY000_02030848 [Brassica cretica]